MSDLPPGWASATLGQLAGTGQYGWTTKAADRGTLRFLRTTDITKGPIAWNQVPYCSEAPPHLEKYLLSSGDILVSRAGSVGFSALLRSVPSPTVFASYLIRFLPRVSVVFPQYLAHFLHSPLYWEQIADASAGIALVNVNATKLARMGVPLAPLPEQQRIAHKLDGLLARVDSCRGHLDRVADILKHFRKAVLAAATSGALTEEWRRHSGAQEWGNYRAADVCGKVQSGGTPKEGFISEPGIPFLKVYNIVKQEIAFAEKPQYVREEIQNGPLAKSRTAPGDVLMNIVGPPLGKVAIVPSTFAEWNINQAIALFRPSDVVSSQWLYLVLCSGVNIERIVHETRGSAGQINISLSQCRDFMFPVPSVMEQSEIVRRVEQLMNYVTRLVIRHTAASVRLNQLIPATLEEAFSGKLVPQNADDEPASELLQRVMSSR